VVPDPLNPNCPLSPQCCGSQPGALDTNFNPIIHFQPPPDFIDIYYGIHAVAVQPDGKILMGGWFDQVNGINRLNIARLNENGTLDLSFDPTTNVMSVPLQIIVQPNGAILVNVGQTLLRLRADGTRDSFAMSPVYLQNAFNPGQINAMALAPDGKIVIVGYFNRVGSLPTGNFMARLLPFGFPDLHFVPPIGFDPQFGGGVEDVVVQSDGKILATGLAYATNGPSFISWNVFRLLDSGVADTSFRFSSTLAFGHLTSLALLPNGDLLIGDFVGLLFGLGSQPDLPPDFTIRRGSIQPQSNGKVLLASYLPPHCIRLNPDGSRDTTFAPNINGAVLNQAVQPDAKIVIGGSFTSVNGVSRTGLARLMGATPCRFQSIARAPGNGVEMTLTGEPYQPYALQVSSDLMQWSMLATNSSPSGAFSFFDSMTSSFTQRYYRAVLLP
jgi:uncharacterized delta-60 repeat protein